MLLSETKTALARALREFDSCYVRSMYALTDALLMNRRVVRELVPRPMYVHRTGQSSLTQDEPLWADIEKATNNNPAFRGMVTSSALVECSCEIHSFEERGYRHRAFDVTGAIHYVLEDSDIIRIDSAPDDEVGAHAAILMDNDERGIFPPHTCFALTDVKQPGEWLAPGGVQVKQRLLVVKATYVAWVS